MLLLAATQETPLKDTCKSCLAIVTVSKCQCYALDCSQVRRDTCAAAAKEMGWEKLFVVQPLQLKYSRNMMAELFEVSALHCT